MKNNMSGILPMKKAEWLKAGVKQEGASLITSLGLVEGDVLDFVETKGPVALKDIVQELTWPEAMVMMSAGALIRDGLVQAKRHNKHIYLEEASKQHLSS